MMRMAATQPLDQLGGVILVSIRMGMCAAGKAAWLVMDKSERRESGRSSIASTVPAEIRVCCRIRPRKIESTDAIGVSTHKLTVSVISEDSTKSSKAQYVQGKFPQAAVSLKLTLAGTHLTSTTASMRQARSKMFIHSAVQHLWTTLYVESTRA
jgi:hypothetical protein